MTEKLEDWLEDFYDGVEYKFKEDETLSDLKKYIDSTYSQHYEGFCVGNIMKYAMRFGKKDGKNPKDLFKIIHYAIIAYYVMNKK